MSTIQCRHCSARVTHVESDFLCTPCHQLTELFPEGESNLRRRGHAFLTAAMLKTIPALYATEDVPCTDKTLFAHFFYGDHDWYIAELDPETGRAFSYCPGFLGEWGYVNIIEMEAVVGAMTIIERDLYFTPTTTRELGSA
jgi:hypothetical protein